MTELSEENKETAQAVKMTKKSTVAKISKYDVLNERIAKLEACIGKMAHFNGGNNPKICKEFGVEVWNPDQKSMTKYG